MMFLDFLQGFDEAVTIFPLLFVAKLYSHLIYYRKVPAETVIIHKECLKSPGHLSMEVVALRSSPSPLLKTSTFSSTK